MDSSDKFSIAVVPRSHKGADDGEGFGVVLFHSFPSHFISKVIAFFSPRCGNALLYMLGLGVALNFLNLVGKGASSQDTLLENLPKVSITGFGPMVGW